MRKLTEYGPAAPAAGGTGHRPPARVLHIITALTTGGAEVVLSRLLSRLDPSRVESKVVCLGSRGPVAGEIEKLGVPLVVLGARAGLPGPATALRLLREARGFAPDVIQGWMYHSNLAAAFAAAACGGKPGMIWGIRQNVSATLAEEKALTRLVIRLGAAVSGLPDLLLYNSQAALGAHAGHGYRTGRAKVLPNGFDTGLYRPSPEARERIRLELGVEPGAMLVGMIARYHPVKDHGTFLEAARELRDAGRRVRFVLAGRGVDSGSAALREAVDSRGLGDRVVLAGERRDVPDLLSALDLHVSASRSEAFSNAIGEAMSCGVPCVATDVGDSARIMGTTGALVPAGDPPAMAAAMGRMLDLGERGLGEEGSRARRRIEETFSLQKMTDAYLEIYETLTSLRQGVR